MIRTLTLLAAASTLGFSAPLTAEEASMTAADYLATEKIIEHCDAANHMRLYAKVAGQGEVVTILPSLGRGVEDYTERFHSTLTTRLVEAGYQVLLIQPRGVGQSRGDLTPANASMSMFAKDIRTVLDNQGISKVNLVGHAWGNRLARTFTTLYPDYVNRLALLAAGGADEKSGRQVSCLANSFNLNLDDAERTDALACAFFAKGHDASIWLGGWYPDLARAQIHAANMINGDFFKAAGGKPFLLVQATEDFIAPPDKAGRPLKAALGDQVSYVEIPHAGHALTSEQPDEIAQQLIGYFRR